jgi:hypothetical protein
LHGATIADAGKEEIMLSQRYPVTARLGGLALAGALLLGSAAPAAAITCSTRANVKNPFYPGKAAGDVYDNRFKESHGIPSLPEHVPQGLATWSNWPYGASGGDLLLITSYDPEQRYALINGVDAKTGKLMGTAKIAYSHVGGIAVFEKLGWAFVSDEESGKVRRYSLKKLADAISTSDKKILDSELPDQDVISSSFLTSHGPTSTLWAGDFKDTAKGGRPHMRAFKVDENGNLKREGGTWEVPIKTQGAVVTKDFFIYSTSLGRRNRGNLYVVRRGKGEADLDAARLFCFRSPSMSEGIAVYGDDLYVAYESGAAEYNPPGAPPSDQARNKIANLHRAPLASLEELPPRSGPTH